MKVILLRDVPKIGRKFDVKEISDGYAHNFLFPRGLAEPATSAKIAALKNRLEADKPNTASPADELKATIKGLDGTTVTIVTKADERGHLFKKLRASDIANAISVKNGITLAERLLDLDSPVAMTGEHPISIVGDGVTAVVVLEVVGEK